MFAQPATYLARHSPLVSRRAGGISIRGATTWSGRTRRARYHRFMLAAIRSAAVFGIDAYDVCVEIDVAQGLPHWTIVGLPAGEVKESRERVSAALANSGFAVPARRITVSL